MSNIREKIESYLETLDDDMLEECYRTDRGHAKVWLDGFERFIKLREPREFLKAWLCGTTCDHPSRKEIFALVGTVVVLKHLGHSEWAGRCTGQTRCGVFYHAFDMATQTASAAGEHGHPMKRSPFWEHTGRLPRGWRKQIVSALDSQKKF